MCNPRASRTPHHQRQCPLANEARTHQVPDTAATLTRTRHARIRQERGTKKNCRAPATARDRSLNLSRCAGIVCLVARGVGILRALPRIVRARLRIFGTHPAAALLEALLFETGGVEVFGIAVDDGI